MSETPRDKTEATLRKALGSAKGALLLPLPAATVQHLAEHLANTLVPAWLHERKCETAGEEIAHVLLMVGLFPPDWTDAHRAEVLAADGQAYDGELAMLRGLVRVLRLAARPDNGLPEVRQLLTEHAGDEAHARLLAMKTASAYGAPKFFQVGHGYTHHDGSDFRCVAVTTHPVTGEPRALGWIVRNGWHEAGALDTDDWAHAYDGCEPPADTQGDSK